MILQILLDMISLQSKLKLIFKPISFLPFLALMILLHCRKLPSEFNVIPSHRIGEQNWFCKVMCVYKGQSALTQFTTFGALPKCNVFALEVLALQTERSHLHLFSW